MSNVEQGIMNVEGRMFVLDCFGANNAHKWNLNRFSFLHNSIPPMRDSAFDINSVCSMAKLYYLHGVTFLYCTPFTER